MKEDMVVFEPSQGRQGKAERRKLNYVYYFIHCTHHRVFHLGVHEKRPVLIWNQSGIFGAKDLGQGGLTPTLVTGRRPAVAVLVVIGLGQEGPAHGHRVGHGVGGLLPHQALELL